MCCASAALPPFPNRSSFPPCSSLSASPAQIADSVPAHSFINACCTRRLSTISFSTQTIISSGPVLCCGALPTDSLLLLFTLVHSPLVKCAKSPRFRSFALTSIRPHNHRDRFQQNPQ